MTSDRPLFHRALFSPNTAAFLVVVAALALATSQARLIHDWAGIVHPGWPAWAWWLYAAGVELAILATGLVLSNTGRRSLWAWEVLLVAASVTIGTDVSCKCLPALVRAFVGGGLALQYLAVISAGFELVTKESDTKADVPTVSNEVVRTESPAPPAANEAPRRGRRKPTDEERATWRRLAADGMTAGRIGRERGWAESTVRDEISKAA